MCVCTSGSEQETRGTFTLSAVSKKWSNLKYGFLLVIPLIPFITLFGVHLFAASMHNPLTKTSCWSRKCGQKSHVDACASQRSSLYCSTGWMERCEGTEHFKLELFGCYPYKHNISGDSVRTLALSLGLQNSRRLRCFHFHRQASNSWVLWLRLWKLPATLRLPNSGHVKLTPPTDTLWYQHAHNGEQFCTITLPLCAETYLWVTDWERCASILLVVRTLEEVGAKCNLAPRQWKSNSTWQWVGCSVCRMGFL